MLKTRKVFVKPTKCCYPKYIKSIYKSVKMNTIKKLNKQFIEKEHKWLKNM